ncbi:protein phosphatase CheZ [Acidovorax kalamii]|uniref:protein phosphatase CheZ n=1 Tax=Acidovorax kalamii TaxID=2004485 RepID=UPI002090B280|nr:protein phosphatase CheZ [Acidovorax kalamii]MCO5358793.1 protein phosphatase CheZ [Acidovorax kalamii]
MMSPNSTHFAQDDAFGRLGRITRQLHEAMTELGLNRSLHAVAQEFPDARDRLSHVGDMTEAAANKVLNLIDAGQPDCRNFLLDSQNFSSAIGQLRQRPNLGSEEVRDALANCEMYGVQAAQFAASQNQLLVQIMMTQDFQDLSGQIIKKVIDIIGQTEKQLLELLMHSAPDRLGAVSDQPKSVLAGPQVPDKALKQGDVDDLLASLGF